MKRRAVFATTLAGFFMPSLSMGISRVGNREIGNPATGVRLSLSPRIASVKETAPEFLTLGFPGLVQRGIHVGDFARLYPEWKAKSPRDLVQTLATRNWKIIPSPHTCARVLKAESSGTMTVILSWNAGQGYVFVGKSVPEFESAVLETIATLEIPGSLCP